MGEFDGKTPFEAGEKAVFEILQVCRRTVGREDQLLRVLMQMIEDVEEGRLVALPYQILDIVDDEYIYLHIISQEVGELVADVHCVHVLGLELVAGHIEDYEVREFLLDGKADCIGHVGFAQAGTAEDEQRIERGLAGIVGNVVSCGDGKAVAVPGNKIAEVVHREQPGVDLYLLEARIYEGTGIAGRLIAADSYGLVHGRIAGAFGKAHGRLVGDRADQVVEPGVGTEHALESFLDDVQIGLFEILAEEVGRNLYCEGGIHEGNGPDLLEPGLEMLRFDYLRNDLQTVVPTVYVFPCIFHMIELCKNG